MAIESKHPGTFKLDATTGATVPTAYAVKSCKAKMDKKTGSHHTTAGLWEIQTEGGLGLEWAVEVLFDNSANTLYDVLMTWAFAGSGQRTLEVTSGDGLTGSRRFTGEVILKDPGGVLEIEPGSGDPKVVTVTLRHSGTVTTSIVV